MKKFKTAIQNYFGTLKEEKTIYALKGFNYWLDGIDSNLFFGDTELFQKGYSDFERIKLEVQQLAQASDTKLILFENLLYLQEEKLLAAIELFTGYKIIIIENNFFEGYYPGFQNNIKNQWEDFFSDEDKLIQIFYSDIQKVEDTLFVNYNELIDNDYTTIRITEVGLEFDIDTKESIELFNNIDLVSMQKLVFEVIHFGIGNIIFEDDKDIYSRVDNLKRKFQHSGLIFTEKNTKNNDRVDSDSFDEYLDILRRKDRTYNFLEIPIYKDPYENTDLQRVSQVTIIDRIVKNSILSQKEGEKFRDIFVTAPTGAGKSIMFQIPAIYLAEKYNLVTIVISPLIGLMNDQVNNIRKLTNLAATINSDYTPAEKDQVLESIKNGEKSILYLSPETLLSNTDIAGLIGDRKIGLLVVDEAHIVATWGKSFRPDYWYLGDFISKLRKNEKSDQNFPIATFTATSTFGGDDNMYLDIIESLRMTPERFLGRVKRDDLEFDINNKVKNINYQDEKIATAVAKINELQKTGEKTLVYVPYTSHIEELYRRLANPNKVGKYYGGMFAGEKNETLEQIVSGEKNVVLATKAFGMGIDINDIKYVYHFAPTGSIPDYVQEIGRAARDKGMIGIATTDFFKEDFRYINQLFGMSSIKNWQIIAVLNKIFDLYRKYRKRNFLVSPMEFSYIFANELDSTKIDAQLKTALLIIKKDFEYNESNYIPLIFKPRSMFTNGYFMIHNDFLETLKLNGKIKYFRKIDLPKSQWNMTQNTPVKVESLGETYVIDFKRLWEEEYKEVSFANFKRLFFGNELTDFDFKVGEKLIQRTIVEVRAEKMTFDNVITELSDVLNSLKDIFDDIKQLGKHFTLKKLAEELKNRISFNNTYTADLLAQSIIYILNNVEIGSFDQRNFATYNTQTDKWNIQNSTYEIRIKKLIKQAHSNFDTSSRDSIRYISVKGRNSNKNIHILLAQVVEILELATVNIRSGDNPEFFIRVNNSNAIEKILRNPYYQSKTVELVQKKHRDSVEIMEYFFTQLSTKEERWDLIERYFLGQFSIKDLDKYKK
ncbi:TPA: DEAD/DEAH box helicase [Streptococcus suis]|nr:ATP-dependent DNA helicase RecQ [Streptococcus suis]